MAEDIENTIRQNAQGPESAQVDGVRVKQHGLRDQIEADKYLAAACTTISTRGCPP